VAHGHSRRGSAGRCVAAGGRLTGSKENGFGAQAALAQTGRR
jgi:hypothetical protein